MNQIPESEIKQKLNHKNWLRIAIQQDRTPFWKSVFFLLIEIAPLNLILWLVTSPEIKFAPYHAPIGVGVALCLVIIVLTTLLTIGGWWLKCHNYDQFIINFGFTAISIGFYITEYWWPNQHFLYRVLVTMAFIFVFIPIGTLIAGLVKNLKLKQQKKPVLSSANDQNHDAKTS